MSVIYGVVTYFVGWCFSQSFLRGVECGSEDLGHSRGMLSVGTWNVLAEEYVRLGHYTEAAPSSLDGTTRRAKVVAWVLASGLDVLGLQEADEYLVEALEEELGGERVLWYPKLGGSIGVATVLGDVELVRSSGVVLQEGASQVAALVEVVKDNVHYRVGNVHLKYVAPVGPESERAGVIQMKAALRAMSSFGGAPSILVGDTNARPGELVRESLVYAGYREYQGVGPSAVIDGVAESIDVVAGFGVQGRARRSEVEVVGIPNEAVPSDHVPLLVDFE